MKSIIFHKYITKQLNLSIAPYNKSNYNTITKWQYLNICLS